MKKIILLLILYLASFAAFTQNIERLMTKEAKLLSPGSYRLDFGDRMPLEEDLIRFFNNRKDIYKLVNKSVYSVYGTLRVSQIIYIVIKELEEYKSSDLAKKSELFRNATTATQWMELRKSYPEFNIRGGKTEFEIVKAIRNDNIIINDFLNVFPEYKENKEFQLGVLKTIYNKKGILEYIELYNDKTNLQKYVVNLEYLANLTLAEYIDIFNERLEIVSWVMNNPNKKTISEIYTVLGKEVTENYFNKYKTSDVFSETDFIDYLQTTKNYTNVTNLLCDKLQTTPETVKVEGKWWEHLGGIIYNTWHILPLRSTVDYLNKTISYTSAVKPYINDDICLKKIDNAVKLARQNITNYNTKIREIQEEAERKQKEYQRKMCDGCEILVEKTTFPYNSEGLFKVTINNPGKIVMKNNLTYDYYQNDDGTWKVDVGWFSSKNIKTFEEMLNHFLEQCGRNYCK